MPMPLLFAYIVAHYSTSHVIDTELAMLDLPFTKCQVQIFARLYDSDRQ